MSKRFSRLFVVAMLVVSAGAMLSASFDAEARRMGGGKSFGQQSSNVTQNRQAATPSAATTTQRSAAAPAAAAGAAGAATAAKSGMSRFLGPLAGIAAGLGIAALLSSMGLSGAFLEMISSMLLIGLLVFGVMFIVRRLRGSAAKPAMQSVGNGASNSSFSRSSAPAQAPEQNTWRQSSQPVAAASDTPAVSIAPVPAAPVDEKWFIPGDFDTSAFLANAKSQFIAIQAVWDSGDVNKLTEYFTDDLIAEFKPQFLARDGSKTETEVVLLNAELLGIEAVSGGHLASVRYSGMLRESKETEAFRFEEVWNLYKGDNAGWLLAGIQQIPVEFES